MSTNTRKITTFDGVRHKLERYCRRADKMREAAVSQEELMLMCQQRNSYSALGAAFRQRLLVFLQTEREEAGIWRDAVTRQFPQWFDLPRKKEDVSEGFGEDWEAFRKLGWFEARPTSDNLSALRKRQRENRKLPDTQLERLVAVNILVESLVNEKLKAKEDSPQIPSYVDAAVQTDRFSQPPILMTSNAASRDSLSCATGLQRKRPSMTHNPSTAVTTPSFRDNFSRGQTPVVTTERPRKRPRHEYSYSSSSSSEYNPSSAGSTSSPPSSAPAEDSLSILEETSVIWIED